MIPLKLADASCASSSRDPVKAASILKPGIRHEHYMKHSEGACADFASEDQPVQYPNFIFRTEIGNFVGWRFFLKERSWVSDETVIHRTAALEDARRVRVSLFDLASLSIEQGTARYCPFIYLIRRLLRSNAFVAEGEKEAANRL